VKLTSALPPQESWFKKVYENSEMGDGKTVTEILESAIQPLEEIALRDTIYVPSLK
jgi:hypothetical protein